MRRPINKWFHSMKHCTTSSRVLDGLPSAIANRWHSLTPMYKPWFLKHNQIPFMSKVSNLNYRRRLQNTYFQNA